MENTQKTVFMFKYGHFLEIIEDVNKIKVDTYPEYFYFLKPNEFDLWQFCTFMQNEDTENYTFYALKNMDLPNGVYNYLSNLYPKMNLKTFRRLILDLAELLLSKSPLSDVKKNIKKIIEIEERYPVRGELPL